jgi:hypothetical protein
MTWALPRPEEAAGRDAVAERARMLRRDHQLLALVEEREGAGVHPAPRRRLHPEGRLAIEEAGEVSVRQDTGDDDDH